MPTRIHLLIRGKVQGVGFRWFVREQARRCELAGWVRNNADGSVELEASGDDDCVARFGTAVRLGPSGARVESVDHVDSGDSPGRASELPYPFRMER